ncbi:MAG: 3-hydroxyacyl-ACP dehydratase FabZ [Nitrospirae bacterium]|nr:3-hydroxyacyl-ACP dehydratase FabZ [Nitrospirota bacterium]
MINIMEILKTLPHRYPFLMVDKVIELVPGESAVGIKNVTINEPFFQGHFPGNPVMPGVLIVEALAQVSGVLAFKSGVEGNTVYFMSIEKAKFRKPVLPGDCLQLIIKTIQKRGKVWRFSGRATVDDNTVAEAEFTAMITDVKDLVGGEVK